MSKKKKLEDGGVFTEFTKAFSIAEKSFNNLLSAALDLSAQLIIDDVQNPSGAGGSLFKDKDGELRQTIYKTKPVIRKDSAEIAVRAQKDYAKHVHEGAWKIFSGGGKSGTEGGFIVPQEKKALLLRNWPKKGDKTWMMKVKATKYKKKKLPFFEKAFEAKEKEINEQFFDLVEAVTATIVNNM